MFAFPGKSVGSCSPLAVEQYRGGGLSRRQPRELGRTGAGPSAASGRRGQTATAKLQITDTANYGHCFQRLPQGPGKPGLMSTVAGLRVYPPNQTASTVIPYPLQACAHTGPAPVRDSSSGAGGWLRVSPSIVRSPVLHALPVRELERPPAAKRYPRAQVAPRSIRDDLRTERGDVPDLAVGHVLPGVPGRFPARHQLVPDCCDPDEAAVRALEELVERRVSHGSSLRSRHLIMARSGATAAIGGATSRACPAARDVDEVGSYLADCRT
jgi:hypothetical protein